MLLSVMVFPVLMELTNTKDARKTSASSSSIMNLFYIGFASLMMAGLKEETSKCDSNNLIPWGFKVNFGLFFMAWLYIRHLHVSKYHIKWNDYDEKVYFKHALFIARTNRYISILGWLAKWHLVELILGFFLAPRNIYCIEEGQKWAY
jgi:hypothetical protein